MSYTITIRTAAGEPVIAPCSDLDALMASLPDDEPVGITLMVAP